jgi:hypothetical protein
MVMNETVTTDTTEGLKTYSYGWFMLYLENTGK